MDGVKYYKSDNDYEKFNNDLLSFNTNDAFLVSREFAKMVIIQNQFFGHGKQYRIANECPFPLTTGPELQYRSPYLKVFNQFLLRCEQAGLLVSSIVFIHSFQPVNYSFLSSTSRCHQRNMLLLV